MSLSLNDLVYDRTLKDSIRMFDYIQRTYANLTDDEKSEWDSCTSKGAWNYTDINRVIEWINYLVSICKLGNIDTSDIIRYQPIYTKDTPIYAEDVNTIQQNLEALRSKLTTDDFSWATQSINSTWNYDKANALEKNIQTVYQELSKMYCYPVCGEALCGGDYL